MTALADTPGLKQNAFSGITGTGTCLHVLRHVTHAWRHTLPTHAWKHSCCSLSPSFHFCIYITAVREATKSQQTNSLTSRDRGSNKRKHSPVCCCGAVTLCLITGKVGVESGDAGSRYQEQKVYFTIFRSAP